MRNILFRQFLSLFTATTFFFSPYAMGITPDTCNTNAENISKAGQALVDQARAAQASVGQQVGSALEGEGIIKPGAGALKEVAQWGANLNQAQAERIAQLVEECNKYCDQNQVKEKLDPKKTNDQTAIETKRKECVADLQNKVMRMSEQAGQAQDVSNQAANTEDASKNESSGGGMSPMMAGLLGAALGAGAAMLLNKKKKDDEKAKEEEANAVVDENGVVNCETDGSEAYSDCNDHFASKCLTDLTSESCKAFSNRYCSSSSSSSSAASSTQSVATSQSGVIIASAEDKDKKGEGVGSQYCMKAQATDFCSTSGRESCPSCLQLEASKAEVCNSNPALCLMQNDPVAIETAKTTCPSDPMFSYSSYTSGGGSTVPNSEGLEDPILPGQYSSSSGSSGSESDTATGATLASAGGGGFNSGSSFGGASDVAGSEDEGSSSVNSRSKRSVSRTYIGSSVGSYKSSNSNRNPTSYGSAMGPSLFSVSSAIIQGKCNKGELAHCRR